MSPRSFVTYYYPDTLHLDKAPRSRSKKQRLYEHVDLTKEFEMRNKKRET